MTFTELILIPRISKRFKALRITKYKKIPPDVISNGQKPTILNIEKGKIVSSGNFISDTLLDKYVKYFELSKIELIFGNEKEQEDTLKILFLNIFSSLIPAKLVKGTLLETRFTPEKKVTQSMKNLAYAFGDFGRWYDLYKEDSELSEEKNFPVDFFSIFSILWKLCKARLLHSFQEKVIQPTFNEIDEKFHFNRIDKKIDTWLRADFAGIIVPEMIAKFKNNSVFKIGFMVKSLIDEFLDHDLPPSFHTDIPLENFYLPVKSYSIHIPDDPKDIDQIATALSEIALTSQQINTIEDLKKFEKCSPFQGIENVTDTSSPFINEQKKVKAQDFLEQIISTPPIFDVIHDLNRKEQKIPGSLTENSQASNLLQVKISEAIRPMIDDLVRFQNIFINCIKWEELEAFAK
ncbi:hypothetical protein M2139_000461 [Enterococcus sp. PF1-24]|uniref:hypothetical protein n=1 Tax=unclassified Enterococcus TaxID=2608891 RepID=UPI00247605BC|nr:MULTISPECIES: hypothetical protein [unclassified Enterococcus]MDH6363486.1 hypothetical protein [Enterococcus sp. PFB1-1]MDH6400580.1 hypothetical protein [Enterococcus sp. PF1-24]